MSADEIIARYYQTGSRLRLTPEQDAELRRDGVEPRVLDFIASHEESARRIDADTAQADREASERDRRRAYRPWGGPGWGWAGPNWGAPGWYDPFWRPGLRPFGGYAWGPRGSGWYGGLGIGF